MFLSLLKNNPLAVSFLIGSAVAVYYYLKNAYSYWIRKGVKGPRPWPFIGNFIQLLINDRMKQQKEWVQRYGKIYGIYRGTKPTLVVADAEILQQICVKDFDAFTNHDVSEFFNEFQKLFLFFQQNEHWKRTRALMSPTFTSGKIKRMFRLLDACADDLVSCFNEQLPPPPVNANGKAANDRRASINMKETYNLFTMDAITTCCYGLKLERASGSNDLKSAANRNDFVRMAMKLFEQSKWRLLLGVAGPKPLLRLFNFRFSGQTKFHVLASTMKQLIDGRRESGKKLDDYLQLLIDAKLDDQMDLNEMDLEENHHAGLTHESLRADQDKLVDDVKDASGAAKSSLSEMEIICGAMFLLIVGLETTSTMLTHCTYLLAFHPEIQDKLYEEVKKIVEYKETDKSKTYFSYEALTSSRYLDSVISETLRFLTPVFSLDRAASRDYHFEKYNLDIAKGTVVTTAFYSIMNDPDYWPEPEKFDPERFMPGNKEKIVPGSYCPFGIGPRHCLGMRFSLTEGKLALAKIIMKHRFEPAPGTQFPPVIRGRIGLASLSNPNVVVVPRDD